MLRAGDRDPPARWLRRARWMERYPARRCHIHADGRNPWMVAPAHSEIRIDGSRDTLLAESAAIMFAIGRETLRSQD